MTENKCSDVWTKITEKEKHIITLEDKLSLFLWETVNVTVTKTIKRAPKMVKHLFWLLWYD